MFSVNNETFILALFQLSYVLLPATSYCNSVGGMCYAIMELPPIGLKELANHRQEARQAILACKCRQAIPSCSHPIIGQGS